MSKKIHTIQSSDKKEFDERVNLFLNVDSVELMEGSYEVIKKDGVVVYSQVVVIDQSKMDIDFFDNGQKEHEGTYKDGKKDGKWTYWHKNGKKKFEGTYKNGKKDGFWIYWYRNGQKKHERTYKNGKKDGKWTDYKEDGTIW